MKKALTFLFLLSGLIAGKVHAQHEGFGAGVIVGEPTGVSAKYWLDDRTALDGALAWSFEGRNSLHFHATWLYHRFDLIEVDNGALPVYYGFGARFKSRRDRVGIRIPVGMAYHFENSPVELFAELAPILDIAPSTSLSINAAIGGRWYF